MARRLLESVFVVESATVVLSLLVLTWSSKRRTSVLASTTFVVAVVLLGLVIAMFQGDDSRFRALVILPLSVLLLFASISLGARALRTRDGHGIS